MSLRPATLVDPAARLRVERAVIEARQGSGAELAVAVVGASGTYASARWRCAVLLAALTGLGLAAFAPAVPTLGVLGAQLAALAAGFGAARIDGLRRCFVADAALEQRARERAEELFASQVDRQHGVLLCVALFERRIVAVAGDAARAALPPGRAWAELVAPIRQGLAAGDLANGLREALEACSQALPPGPVVSGADVSGAESPPPSLVWLEDSPVRGD